MKKIFSLLLVAALLATAALCAFSASAASTKNIALGKTVVEQKISTHSGVSYYNAELTDGEAANTMSWGNPDKEWYSFYYSKDATEEGMVNVEHSTADDGTDVNVGTVIIDLASVSTVDSIKIHFEKDYLPATAELLLSEDGKSYTTFAKKDITTESGTVEEAGMWVEFTANAADGRYVKLVCTFSSMFCMLNEIEVYGTEKAGGNTGSTSGEQSKEESKTESSTPAASEDTSSDNGKPSTGDEGMIAFAALAVLALAGTFVAIRVRH